jgi:hypothetical protein
VIRIMVPQEPTKNDVPGTACDTIGATLDALTNLSIELQRLVHSTDNEDVRAVNFNRLAEVTAELRDLQSALLGRQEYAQRCRELLAGTSNPDEPSHSTR